MPFLYSIKFGQDTLLLTLLVAWAVCLCHRGRDIPAGVILAFAGFKPHLIWALPIALATVKRWKMINAFLATAAFLALFSVALVGPSGVMDWVGLLQAPSTDFVPDLMVNVRSLGLHWGSTWGVIAATAATLSFGAVLKHGLMMEKLSAALFSWSAFESPYLCAGLLADSNRCADFAPSFRTICVFAPMEVLLARCQPSALNCCGPNIPYRSGGSPSIALRIRLATAAAAAVECSGLSEATVLLDDDGRGNRFVRTGNDRLE